MTSNEQQKNSASPSTAVRSSFRWPQALLSTLRILLPAILVSLAPCALAQGQESSPRPLIPGLHSALRKSPQQEQAGGYTLDEGARGRVLLEELNCVGCHAGLSRGVVPRQLAPDLAEVGWRVSADYLQRYISDPAAEHPGTKMPNLLAAMPADQARKISEALTHFLVSRDTRSHANSPIAESDVARGANLYHSVGCVACHGARRPAVEGAKLPVAGGGAVRLTHVPGKYSQDSLADFLFQPRRIRPAGRMPDMGLSRDEARAIASYLIGMDAPASALLITKPELVTAGEQHFKDLNCTGCHKLEGIEVTRLPTRKALNPRRGCLSADDKKTPRYALDEAQRSALIMGMSSRARNLTDEARMAATLATFNCIACHERDGYGGVDPALNEYFQTDEPNLGDPARIPPRLTLAGAKLQGEWLRKVLFDGASVRPYMHTRMPQFGEDNLGHLPALLASMDHVEPFEMPVYKGDRARDARDGGRKLLGSKGLGCISCHNFNGRLSPNMKGLDLIDSCDRLQPGWFKAFLVAPQKYIPGIVMPQSWPGGKAAHTTILEGDTDAQIRGIWFFLAAGRTAGTPEGLKARPSLLPVTDLTRTYRGRSGIAGYRGIAVGFPGGVNYAFNANNGALTGFWRGDYISVRWDGQGAGGFNPAARSISLAQDVGFYRLQDDSEPWPLHPVKTKEQPINPDPLYPRNRGYRFRGYYLDEADIPTFMYESGAIAIEDRSHGRIEGGRALLTRVVSFHAPAAEKLWFRALVGDVETLTPGSHYRLGKLSLKIDGASPATRVITRPTTGEKAQTELLLELTIPAGVSEWSFEYEIKS